MLSDARDFTRNCLLASSFTFLWIFTTNVKPQEDEKKCAPYLISNAELTRILEDNIRNTPLFNSQAIASTDDACRIQLTAQIRPPLDLIGSVIEGCASPIHNGTSVGLSDIHIHQPIAVSIPANLADVSARIIEHCGEVYSIQSTRSTNDGVLLFF